MALQNNPSTSRLIKKHKPSKNKVLQNHPSNIMAFQKIILPQSRLSQNKTKHPKTRPFWKQSIPKKSKLFQNKNIPKPSKQTIQNQGLSKPVFTYQISLKCLQRWQDCDINLQQETQLITAKENMKITKLTTILGRNPHIAKHRNANVSVWIWVFHPVQSWLVPLCIAPWVTSGRSSETFVCASSRSRCLIKQTSLYVNHGG